MGLGIALLVYWLQRELGVRPWIALVLSVLFSVAPGTVLHENLFLYEYPQLLALLAATVAAIRFFHPAPGKRDGRFFSLRLWRDCPYFARLTICFGVLSRGAVFVFPLVAVGTPVHDPARYLSICGSASCVCVSAVPHSLCQELQTLRPVCRQHMAGRTGQHAYRLATYARETRRSLLQRILISSIGRIPAASPLADYQGVPASGGGDLEHSDFWTKELNSTGRDGSEQPALSADRRLLHPGREDAATRIYPGVM